MPTRSRPSVTTSTIEARWAQAQAMDRAEADVSKRPLVTVCHVCGGSAKAVLVPASTLDPSWSGMVGTPVVCSRCAPKGERDA